MLGLIAVLLSAVAIAAMTPSAVAKCPMLGCQPPPPSEPPPAPPLPPAPTTPPAPTAGADPRGVNPASPNPLVGLRFFVDKRNPAWRQYRWYRRKHRRWAAGEMWKIAREPKFKWFGRWSRPLGVTAREFIVRAQQRGEVPLMTVMRHQGRGCNGHYTGGGSREDARTRRWYRSFARAVGSARVVIAFEPDSLGTIDCLSRSRRRARMKTLAYGVDVLSKLPNATIYLEGGASDWESARRTAWQLRSIGISKVRGFMLNVTHYDWALNNIRHGLKISRLTGGKHFIISTAFNGRGPVHYRKYSGLHRWRVINVWCHPLRRGLGPAPRTFSAYSKMDAYMWIGRPGYSGGSCNGGPLPVGSWWPERALMLARWSTSWIRPPAGTRYGHRTRYTLSQLGG